MSAGVYDTGGWLQPGLTLAYNGTGQPERVVGPNTTASPDRPAPEPNPDDPDSFGSL